MLRRLLLISLALALGPFTGAFAQAPVNDPEASARSWQKRRARPWFCCCCSCATRSSSLASRSNWRADDF